MESAEGKTTNILQTMTNGLDQLFHRGQVSHGLKNSQNNLTQGTHQTYGDNQRNDFNQEDGSESSDATIELSRQSVQSSDDENLFDSRIKEKSTDEKTIKNQIEFTKGIPKNFTSVFNDKLDSRDLKEQHILWQTAAQASAASITNEVNVLKYTHSGFTGRLQLLAEVIFNFDTLISSLLLALKILMEKPEFIEYVTPVLFLVFSIGSRLILKLMGDKKRHILQCQFNYNFQKKFFKAKKKQAEKGEKGQRRSVGGYFAADLWENLKIGDIIVVKQNQEFPADVMILDSEYRSINTDKRNTTLDEVTRATIQTLKEKIIVQSGSDTRFKLRQKQSFPGTMMKNRVVETQKVSQLQVVNSLTGTLQWEFNLKGFFCGSFRFADGTGNFDINTDNIIKRGTFLRSNHKLVCLVLNVGDSCMSSMPKYTHNRNSALFQFFQTTKNWFWNVQKQEYRMQLRHSRGIGLFVFCFFLLFEGIQMTIQQQISFESQNLSSATNPQKNVGLQHNSQETICQTAVIAICCIPLFFEIVFKALIYMQAHFAEWDLNLIPSNLRFNNLNSMGKLPWISHIITSPSTLEGTQTHKVTYFRVGDQSFYNNESQINNTSYFEVTKMDTTVANQENTNTQNATSQNQKVRPKDLEHDDSHVSFSTSEDLQFNFEYLPQQRNQTSFEFSNIKADLFRKNKNDIDSPLLTEFLRSLALCHQATHKTKETILEQGPRLSHFRSFIEEEEGQLMFAKQYGCTFAHRKSQVISIQLEDRVERYEELAYVHLKLKDGCSKVYIQVLRPFNKSGTIIINLKGPGNAITDTLCVNKGTTRQFLANEALRLEKLGINLQFFCQRELTKGESASFKQSLDSLNIYQVTFADELNNLCAEYCKQMKIIGLLGLQKVVPLRNTLTVQDCIKNGVKMWLLSQYSKRKTLLNCNNLNLLLNSEHVEITGTSEREIEDSLRTGFYKIFETENKKRTAQANRADADEDERLEQVKLDDLQVKNNVKASASEKIKNFVLKLFGVSNYKRVSKKNFVENKKTRILLVSSSTLLIIVRDEGLVKLFLSLSTYCDIIIGSGVNPELKSRLAKEVVNFCKVGRDSNQTYVMSIVGSPEDRNLSQKSASDVCCFLMNRTNAKDIELNSDITIQHFYAVTYLLFKHGSQLHRRLVVAGRFHLRKSIFMVMMYIMHYFNNGFSVGQMFKKYFLAVYLSFGFEILAFVCAALYENEAFAFLHRVNGQYKCNATLKVFNTNMLISQCVELIFDTIVILILAGVVTNSGYFTRQDGYTIQSEGASTMYDLALIFYTIPLFIKLPRVNQTSLMLLFCVFVVLCLTQAMDQDFDNMQIYFQTPQCLFQLLLIIGIFALKFQVKRVMRTINPYQSSWDNFNSYVEERLELEQYESFEQLKFFDMENSYNADRLIDVAYVQERRNIHQINQNLLKLTRRTDLTDLLFEYVSQINKRKVGQSVQQKLNQETNQKGIGIENQKIFKESANTIDPYTLNFKQIHQEQDFLKYKLTRIAFDKIRIKDLTYQIVWLILMYSLLIIQIVLRMFLSDSYKQLNAGVNSNQFIFYIIILICCLFSILMVQTNQVARKDIVLLILTALIHIFTIAQIEINYGFCKDLEHNLTIAVIIAFSMINRTIHTKYVLIICWITSFWCLSLNLRLLELGGPYQIAILQYNPSYEIDKSSTFILDLQACYYFLGIPVLTAVWSIYIYFDQAHIKTNFLVLSKRIKEFKFLKLIMQRLVSESIRKYTDGRTAASSVDLMKNFTIIVVKIFNYKNLETSSEDQQMIYNVFQKIQTSIQKVAARHGVFLVNSTGERFLFVSGVKQFEKNISQKILSIHHTQRACKFAIELIQASKEISKQTNQNVNFHAGIHSPSHIACGIIGEIRPAFTIIGNGLLKTDMVCERAQVMQICLTKDAYDMLGLFGIKMNIRVNGTFQYFANTEKEIVYELQAKHRSKMVMKSTNRRHATRTSTGSKGELEAQQKNQMTEQALEDQQIPDVLSSTHESGRSQRESETDASGQLQSMMTFNSETKIDNSDATYVQTDYQFQMGAEFKDDQEIANNPALNQQYKLVLRSNWLLSFINTQSENKFTWQCYFELLNQNIIFSFLMLIFIFLGIVILFNKLVSQKVMRLQLIWIFALLILAYITQYRLNKISEQKVMFLEYLHIGLALIFIVEYLAISFVQVSVSNYSSFTQVTIAMLVVVCGQRGWRFRSYLMCNFILILTLVGNQVYFILQSQDPYPKIGEIISTFVLAGLLTHHTYSREIIMRIDYNLNMMLTVEEQKHEDSIKKLMPTQALVSIKKEESFTQQLSDATILIACLSGFEEVLCQQTVDMKPHIAYQFIKAVYDKFDLIIEHQNIYKLFSNCKQYIVMSSPTYTTEHSSDYDKTMQAYKVIQVGKAMIQTVQDTKKQWIELMRIQKENIDFSEIQLRFSINSGNLLGYVSGSTFLQYQVLGSPLAHCTILSKHAPLNTINISEATKKLLDKVSYISEALDVVESQEVEVNDKVKIKTFNVTVSDDQQMQQENSDQVDDSGGQELASSSKSRSISGSGTSQSLSRSSGQVQSQ